MMEKTLKEYVQDYYFKNNFNCAETLIHAGNDYYQLGISESDMRMVSGFGAGMQVGHTCGAILAAVSLLSMRYVKKNAHESSDIKAVTSSLMKMFNEKYHSYLCKDIRPQSFQKEIRCLNTILTAADILEESIRGFEEKK